MPRFRLSSCCGKTRICRGNRLKTRFRRYWFKTTYLWAKVLGKGWLDIWRAGGILSRLLIAISRLPKRILREEIGKMNYLKIYLEDIRQAVYRLSRLRIVFIFIFMI